MKILSFITGILLTALLLPACKNELYINPEQYIKVYMPQAKDYPASRPFVMTDTLQYIIFGAAYGGVDDQPRNITVQFKTDNALVADFNLKNGTSYLPMPAGSYELEATEAVIPSGKFNSTPLKIKVKTVGGIEPIKEYLLPVTIVQTGPDLPVNEDLRTVYFLVQGTYEEFDRSGWSITDLSSDEPPNIGANAFDNKTNTQWHTQWKAAKPAPPHHVTIDMNEVHSVHGFYIWPVNKTSGNAKDVHIELSMDGVTWNDAGSYTYPNVYEKHIVYLASTMQARYFRFTVDATFSNTHFTHIAEIGAF